VGVLLGEQGHSSEVDKEISIGTVEFDTAHCTGCLILTKNSIKIEIVTNRKISNKERDDVRALIKDLREEVKGCCSSQYAMSTENLGCFADYLAEISPYKYDKNKYPSLIYRGPKKYALAEEPTSLAQLFIWKRGDWTKFENFVEYYLNSAWDEAPKKRVVNFAFAQHLKSHGELPIFDQHSARAIWAIMGSSHSRWDNYQDYSFYKPTHWRTDSEYLRVHLQADCYYEFLGHVWLLAAGGENLVQEYAAADKLLMPLGKAIKDHVKTLDEFRDLCNF